MRKQRHRVSILAILLVFISGILITPVWAAMPTFEPEEGVYLMDPYSGDAYYKQHEEDRYYPASTTKMMTALVAMDYISDHLSETITVGPEITWIDPDSSVAELDEEDTYTWEQLLYGLMLPSGNDAAMTIAVNVARINQNDPNFDAKVGVDVFVGLMNKKAESLGLTHTHFANPHGLVQPEHYTTPKDMAMILKAAMDVPAIKTIAGTEKYQCVSGKGKEQEWKNSNLLIHKDVSAINLGQVLSMNLEEGANPYYNEYTKAGKTGFDDEAGRCLIFESEKGDMSLVGVVFKSGDQNALYQQVNAAINTSLNDYTHILWHDGSKNYDNGFVFGGTILDGCVIGANSKGVAASTVPIADKDKYSVSIKWNEEAFEDHDYFLVLKKAVEEGEEIAGLEVRKDDQVTDTIPLYASHKIGLIGVIDYAILGGIVLLLILIIVLIVRHRKKKKQQDYYNERRSEIISHQQNKLKAEAEAVKETLAEEKKVNLEDTQELPTSFLEKDMEDTKELPASFLEDETEEKMDVSESEKDEAAEEIIDFTHSETKEKELSEISEEENKR